MGTGCRVGMCVKAPFVFFFFILLNLYLTGLVPLRSISRARNTWSRQLWAEQHNQHFIGSRLRKKKKENTVRKVRGTKSENSTIAFLLPLKCKYAVQ